MSVEVFDFCDFNYHRGPRWAAAVSAVMRRLDPRIHVFSTRTSKDVERANALFQSGGFILRDASLRDVPQDEVFPRGEERGKAARLEPRGRGCAFDDVRPGAAAVIYHCFLSGLRSRDEQSSLLEHDEISLSCDRSGSRLPLPLGEGWGEGLRSLVKQSPLTRFAAQIDLSPPGRGELSPRSSRFNQKSFVPRGVRGTLDEFGLAESPPHPDRTGRCFASPRRSDLSPRAGRGAPNSRQRCQLKARPQAASRSAAPGCAFPLRRRWR
jgi:hypothetical protein